MEHNFSDNTLFSLEGVSLHSATGPILDRISLTLEPLKLYLIAGPSGGGKTSLLRLLNGLTSPTSGEVRYRGKLISEYDLPRLRSEVVMLTQEPVMAPGTVEDNIMAPFSFASNRSKVPNDDLVPQLIAELGLRVDILKQNVKILSGGEKQRVALIRALLPDPKVLIIDEPTSALDPLSEEKVIAALTRISTTVSLIVVSHSTRFLGIASEIILISAGKVVGRRKSIDAMQFREFLRMDGGSDG